MEEGKWEEEGRREKEGRREGRRKMEEKKREDDDIKEEEGRRRRIEGGKEEEGRREEESKREEEEGRDLFPVEIGWEQGGWSYHEVIFWDAEKREEKEILLITREIVRDIILGQGKFEIDKKLFESK